MENSEYADLTPEQAMDAIRHYEKEFDYLLYANKMTQEQAWEGYFCIFIEAKFRGFHEDCTRIYAKIDFTKYNPFSSSNPEVVMLARQALAFVEQNSNSNN
ncbi:MAG: hypothetical protein Q7S73_00690 [bacterium]|nr:hypothetical protein [bacterium]